MNGIYGFISVLALALLSACDYGLVDHDNGREAQVDTAVEADSGVEVEVVEDSGGSSAGSDDSATVVCYWDADGDGYGNGNVAYGDTTWETCPVGYVANGDDCDDGDDNVHPGATETDNDVDDDCDGTTDEGFDAPDDTTDVDDDGDGWTVAEGDCDDGWEYTNPGEVEWCGDSADNDCDGAVDEGCDDADGDGYTAGDDCDDNNDDINPDADEVCGNSTDEDCDGLVEDCEEEIDLTREVCVVKSTSNYRLAYEDLGTSDRSHWVTYSGGEAYVASPIATGNSGDTDCVTITLSSEGVELKFSGSGSDSELWGEYLVGEEGDGDYCDTDDGLAAEIRVEVDGESVGFCDDSNDLCWTD